MKNPISPRLGGRVIYFGIGSLMLSGLLQGDIILHDDFTAEEDQDLEARAPSVVDNGKLWFDSNGMSSVLSETGTLSLLQAGTSAFLEIDALEDSTIYRVSCNLVVGNDDWVGPAFFTSSDPANWWEEGYTSSFAAIKPSGAIELWPNGLAGSKFDYATLEEVVGVFAIELGVDDTGAASVEYYWNGELIGSGFSLTAEEIDEIKAVGFAVSGSTAAEVDDFVFESRPNDTSDPVVTEVMMVENGFRLAGSGGPANGAFEILRAPDLASSPSLWTSIGSGLFDASGEFDYTDTDPSGAENFYILREPPEISSEGEE